MPANGSKWGECGGTQCSRRLVIRSRGARARRLKRLRDEEDRYRNKTEGHRTYFEAMNVALGSVGVAASTRPEVAGGEVRIYPCSSRPEATGQARWCGGGYGGLARSRV